MKLLVAGVLGLASLQAIGQWTFGKATYKNAGAYQQADLDAVLMLHKGEKVSTESLQTAAQRLMDTGYFSDVGVGTAGTTAALELVLTLKPLSDSQMTAVGFENFVWLTPEELHAAVHKAAPLFHGRLPDTGSEAEKIQAALTAAVAAKGQRVTVTSDTIEATTEQPLRAVEFRVERPRVVVSAVRLQGVSAAMAPSVEAATKRLVGSTYNAGLAGATTEGRLLEPYQNAGYLEATLTDVKNNIIANDAGSVGVEIAGNMSEGAVYHVASLEYAGTAIAPASVLDAPPPVTENVLMRPIVHRLKPGDLASRKELLGTLWPIESAYRRQGYMDVVIDPGATLDKTAHTVAYKVSVVPGEQYRIAELKPTGLDPAAQAEFNRAWTMREGDLYNVEYVRGFLINNSGLRSLANYTFAYRAEADPLKHTVILTLTFRSGRR